METLLPILASLVSGGSLLTFVLGLLQRHDAQLLRLREADRRSLERGRVYELAFRRADAWSRQLAQLAAPVATASSQGEDEFVEALLGLLAGFLGEETERGWHLKEHPDFLAEARRELELVEGSAPD